MHILAQMSGSSGGPPAGIFALVGLFWCFGITLGLSSFVMFIVALVQILSRANMPSEAKLLWCLVSWLVPLVGPILWWTIGAKQHPAGGRPPMPPA
jgi:hypothetical protein